MSSPREHHAPLSTPPVKRQNIDTTSAAKRCKTSEASTLGYDKSFHLWKIHEFWWKTNNPGDALCSLLWDPAALGEWWHPVTVGIQHGEGFGSELDSLRQHIGTIYLCARQLVTLSAQGPFEKWFQDYSSQCSCKDYVITDMGSQVKIHNTAKTYSKSTRGYGRSTDDYHNCKVCIVFQWYIWSFSKWFAHGWNIMHNKIIIQKSQQEIFLISWLDILNN